MSVATDHLSLFHVTLANANPPLIVRSTPENENKGGLRHCEVDASFCWNNGVARFNITAQYNSHKR